MFGIGIWEIVIPAIIGLICLGTIGGIVAAVVIASGTSRRGEEKLP